MLHLDLLIKELNMKMKTKMKLRMKALMKAQQRAPSYRRIEIKNATHLKGLCQIGWRAADLYQPVDELRSQLAWFVYVNGTKRLYTL